LCERLKEGLTGGAGLSAETPVERGASAVRPQAGLGRGWAGRGRAGGKELGRVLLGRGREEAGRGKKAER